MAEIERLEQLVHQMAQQITDKNAKMVEREAKMADENAKLIASMSVNPGQQQPMQQQQPDVAAIRANKLAKLSLALRKSGKVKDYKDTQDSNVEEWLKRFDQEVLQIKKI